MQSFESSSHSSNTRLGILHTLPLLQDISSNAISLNFELSNGGAPRVPTALVTFGKLLREATFSLFRNDDMKRDF